jgi:hypothetical protein
MQEIVKIYCESTQCLNKFSSCVFEKLNKKYYYQAIQDKFANYFIQMLF